MSVVRCQAGVDTRHRARVGTRAVNEGPRRFHSIRRRQILGLLLMIKCLFGVNGNRLLIVKAIVG